MAGSLARLCCLCAALPPSLAPSTPLTEIAPDAEELHAFAATLSGALRRLRAEGGGLAAAAPVVHVVGASSVEAVVDWGSVCTATDAGGGCNCSLVLAGPQAEPPSQQLPCVRVVPGLWSRQLLRSTDTPPPDVVLLHNADLYMIHWRRTLAEMLQLGVPVVLTTYCEYEGHQLDRLLKWPELEFSPEAFAECDNVARRSFADHAEGYTEATPGAVPEAKSIWTFERNPHAHKPPANCYGDAVMSGRAYGTRNAYWMAFAGETVAPPPKAAEEL